MNEQTKYYIIRGTRSGEPEVKELTLRKDTPKTVQVSDGFNAYNIRKIEFPFKWTPTHSSLITTDKVSGMLVWDMYVNDVIEKTKAKLERLAKLRFDNIEKEVS